MDNIKDFFDKVKKKSELKEKLSALDYKTIKCIETLLSQMKTAGTLIDMPYDIADIVSEKQILRDEFNTLESAEDNTDD